MENENLDFFIARAGSGYTHEGAYYDVVQSNNKIFNLQIRYWIEAVNKFESLDGEYIIEEALLIINALCNSLETLAGVNVDPPKNDHTPAMMTMFKDTLVKDRGWNLLKDKPELFE